MCLTRHQKVKALQAIAAGTTTTAVLSEGLKVVARKMGADWLINGQLVTDTDYQERLAAFKVAASHRKAIGLPDGYFISVWYHRAP